MTSRAPSEWRETFRGWGLELGFSSVGFATAAEPPGARAHLLEWLARGHQAGMHWMTRAPERRVDPELILPGARSVIVATLLYDHPWADETGELPRIARYARGDDYHEVLGERLHALLERIQRAFPAVRARVACDTSPVLEKAWAERAGVGWLGKNACVIHPRHGSWFFLGEIFLDLELPPDPPAVDRCGSCTRCLDVCPTGAFPAPYQLDSRRCIAYWNIEHRGEMPPPAAAGIGEWLVGCDLCQEVCPWNRKAPASEEPRLRPRHALVTRSLEEWLGMGDEEYRALIRGSAITRIKPADMRRNARHIAANRQRGSSVTRRSLGQ